MKSVTFCTRILSFLVVMSLFALSSFSQISVVSSTGYAVNIDVRPISIIPTQPSCNYGYNYNVKLNYNITITGNNAPGSLYTLQGTLGCGSSSHFFNLPNNGGSGTVTSGSNVWVSTPDCGAATVSSKNCNVVNILIEGPGISSRTVSFAAAPAPLGVTLLSFDAKLDNDKVKLSWLTASETDNDYFTIERSADGSHWESLKQVRGAGNSSSLVAYESYDETPLSGTSYYRLKQTDLDGKMSYSGIQTVKNTSTTKGIAVYPVPNSGNSITLSGLSDYRNQELSVINAGGKTLFSTSLSKATVELPVLQPGLYFIRVQDKTTGQSESLRYVKI